MVGFDNLVNGIKAKDNTACWRLEKEIYYQYNGTGDLFSKTFAFKVVDDLPEHYTILVEEQFETVLEKTFELIDAINDGTIFKLGTAEEIGLDFDIREYIDEVIKLNEEDFEDEE